MKASKNLPQLKELLKSKGLLEKSVLVSRCGLEDERIDYGLSLTNEEKISYFTTVIVKKNGI